MVSKVALRSSRIRMDKIPESAPRRLLVILIGALSVELRDLDVYEDYCRMSVELRSNNSFKDFGKEWTIRNRLKNIEVIGINVGFLSVGVTTTVFRDEGTIPVTTEEWIM